MAEKDDDKKLQQPAEDEQQPTTDSKEQQEVATEKEQQKTTFKELRKSVSEEDSSPMGTPTLRKILGGDVLSSELVRRQVWLFLLVVFFIVVYVASRYQCQQDMIAIDKLEKDLLDAKYKALSSSSNLTEKCRESHVLEVLRANSDSTLHGSDQPPYIIYVPEE